MECIDRAVAGIAAVQHGLVSASQLQGLGATRQQVRTRLDRGQWRQVDPAVIRIAGLPETWESEVLTAVLAAGKGALASHRTAARLWGIETMRADVVEITIPRGRRYRRPGVIAHQSTDLDRTTATIVNGIPTTLVARTLLDLGAVVPKKLVLLAIDEARRKRLTNWRLLLDCLVVHARRGRDGAGSLRAVLEDHYGEMTKLIDTVAQALRRNRDRN